MFKYAITRRPCRNFADGITTVDLGRPDYDMMLQQHDAYIAVLKQVGISVTVLEAEPDYPDAHFVEDPAIVVDEIGIITRPGAVARQGEEVTLAPVLAAHRQLATITAPGTLDGGDVLVVDKDVFVGLTERTNAEGVAQLTDILSPFGYKVVALEVAAGLHFKSSVNHVGGKTLVVSEAYEGHPLLADYEQIVVDADEAHAANSLFVNGSILTPAGFPKLRAKLDTLGYDVVEMNTTEMEKMDGGLTCLSLRFR